MKNLLSSLRSVSVGQLLIASVFAVVFSAAISLGTMTRQSTSASSSRECNNGSVNYVNLNGGCGALSPAELVADLRSNQPGDFQAIAQNFTPGFTLPAGEYDNFVSRAKMGTSYKDGRVVVDGQVVLTNAWTISRIAYRNTTAMDIPGAGTFYRAPTQQLYINDSVPVMVYFNAQGVVQYVAMSPCSNPIGGDKVIPSATCKALNATLSDTNPNLYTFTTDAEFGGNAALSRVVYTFGDDGTSVTTNSLSAPVTHTFKKSGTVTVKVYATVPGGGEIEAAVINCAKQIDYVPPMFTCAGLVASIVDDNARKFRFTVKAASDKYTQLLNADFNLDGTATTAVTAKDANGDIYQEYTLDDGKTHKVIATVHFNTLEGATSVDCEASVTPAKKPMCTVPGKETLPPESPDCKADKPKVLGATSLPKTGAGDVAGMFAGTSAIGAVAHRLFSRRKQ